MSENSGGGPTFSLSGAAIILALLGALVVQELPLHGSRPEQREASGYDIPGREDVPARLWQDPFAAVQQYLKGREKKGPKLGEGTGITPAVRDEYSKSPLPKLCVQSDPRDPGADSLSAPATDAIDSPWRERARWVRSHSALDLACQIHAERRPVTVLGVMVFGGPYVEAAEHRTRRRYAVVSALDSAGYTPLDSEHISYIADPIHRSLVGDSPGNTPPFIPFEWYEPRTGHARNPVLLLWLDDDGYRYDPFRRLTKTLGVIFPEGMEKQDRVKIIGPAGSNTLRAMALELGRKRELVFEPLALEVVDHLEIYSPTATATDALILEPVLGESQEDKVRLSEYFKGHSVELRRTIPTDLQLSELLVEELSRRGLSIEPARRLSKHDDIATVEPARRASKHDHIVLISEWDTLYGRALPKAFEDSVRAACSKSLKDENDENAYCPEDVSWLHRFSYLRGLDGRIPNTQGNGEGGNAAKRSGDSEGPRRASMLARAEGQSQVDYTRRLAREIEGLDDRLKSNKEGRIKAIGVMGSDVYDKLLILQAVRRRFSDVIFFTTDLDARLLHPAEYPWTRNLLIASGFGLSLNAGLQGQIPPFRDSYQASVFLSVLAALAAEVPPQSAVDRWLEPRIFEVGRHGAFDLSPLGEAPSARVELQGLPIDRAVPLHPPGPDFFPKKNTFWSVFSLLIFGVVLLAAVSDEFREFVIGAWRYALRNPGIACVVVIVLIAVPGYTWVLISNEGRSGEPFSLTEGISIWPTELLRSIAAFLAIYFLARCWREIKKSNKKIQGPDGEFRLNPKEFPVMPPSGFLERVLQYSVFRWRREKRGSHQLFGTLGTTNGISSGGANESVKAGCEWLDIRKIWAENQFLGTFSRRLGRSIFGVLIYMVLASILVRLFDRPFIPYRGYTALWIDRTVLFVSVISMLVLIFFVVDATRLCRVFIEKLVDGRVAWPASTVQSCCGQYRVSPGFAMEVLNIKLIASRTDTISRLIYYPFLVLFLMIISRITYFDDWDLPLGLAIIFLLNALYLVYCAIVMRRTAISARDAAIDRLEKEQMRVTKMGGRESPLSEQVDVIVKYLREIHSGAFVPIHQQPLVRSLLLPFGALGLSVLDYLSLAS